LVVLNLIDDLRNYQFHDTRLNENVVYARHALAADEMRDTFAPTFWTEIGNQDVKQIWFPGVHSDVGGGYPETGLSDGALKWMIEEAYQKGQGLQFDTKMLAQVKPNSLDILHNSRVGLFKYLRTEPRSLPFIGAGASDIHASLQDRQSNPPINQPRYRPSTKLDVNKQQALPIYANQLWNETGIFLEADATYDFSATGQWLDRNLKSGPGGSTDGKFHASELIHLAGSLLGKIEGAFKKLTGNEEADFHGSKRVESLGWFALVGVVTNGMCLEDGTLVSHEIIPIKEGCTFSPKRSGYLYCFANDSWHFYDSNQGSVSLSVRRTR
jgi:hypothetical protein